MGLRKRLRDGGLGCEEYGIRMGGGREGSYGGLLEWLGGEGRVEGASFAEGGRIF